jgi:hypothetical protein
LITGYRFNLLECIFIPACVDALDYQLMFIFKFESIYMYLEWRSLIFYVMEECFNEASRQAREFDGNYLLEVLFDLSQVLGSPFLGEIRPNFRENLF